MSCFHCCYGYHFYITIIASINIFINFLNVLFFWFVLFCVFCFGFFCAFLIKQLLFSHETGKESKLLCLFVCLFVCLFYFLSRYGRLKIYSFIVFSNSQKFTALFIYCYFNVVLHFILSFTIFVATNFIIN